MEWGAVLEGSPSMATGEDRPRVLYISYDGACERLGRSQVVAYLEALAANCDITLISFEKPHDERSETHKLLAAAGVEWIPLGYHRRPAVISTVWDIALGARMARRAVRRKEIQVVHTRSYVAAVMALLSAVRRSWMFLFDIRGFWVDERVEGGLWRPRGFLYKLGKRFERWLFRCADGVVTLTHASVPQIRTWTRSSQIPIRVIPTCVAVDRFRSGIPRRELRVTWCGSLGTCYRFELAVALAEALRWPLTVLTRDADLAGRMVGDWPADIRSVAPEEIPRELAPGDIGLCFCADGVANPARAPTRIAEYLAAGMVLAVTSGLGDLESGEEPSGRWDLSKDQSGRRKPGARSLQSTRGIA
jgi:hypothetical protein